MRRRDIRYLVLEGFVVVFGVLAALVVEGIREDRAQERAAAAAVDRVLEEVRQNLGEMQELDSVARERLGALRELRHESPNVALADLVDRFVGYRSPELSGAAWNRISSSDLGDVVEPQLMADAFHVYEWNTQFDQLDREINRLVYSEVFYAPVRRDVAIDISERIMEQQLAWARVAMEQYRAFLDRYGPPAGPA